MDCIIGQISIFLIIKIKEKIFKLKIKILSVTKSLIKQLKMKILLITQMIYLINKTVFLLILYMIKTMVQIKILKPSSYLQNLEIEKRIKKLKETIEFYHLENLKKENIISTLQNFN